MLTVVSEFMPIMEAYYYKMIFKKEMQICFHFATSNTDLMNCLDISLPTLMENIIFSSIKYKYNQFDINGLFVLPISINICICAILPPLPLSAFSSNSFSECSGLNMKSPWKRKIVQVDNLYEAEYILEYILKFKLSCRSNYVIQLETKIVNVIN